MRYRRLSQRSHAASVVGMDLSAQLRRRCSYHLRVFESIRMEVRVLLHPLCRMAVIKLSLGADIKFLPTNNKLYKEQYEQVRQWD